jgi:two-component system aerobic respiration control sensor histidine kinase ArcB
MLTEDEMPLPALNVLLVEDIELNVIVARSVLEKLGNSVDVAMTGKAALEMFEPGEYDLVLLDIQLPDMTGLDISLCRRRATAAGCPDRQRPEE